MLGVVATPAAPQNDVAHLIERSFVGERQSVLFVADISGDTHLDVISGSLCVVVQWHGIDGQSPPGFTTQGVGPGDPGLGVPDGIVDARRSRFLRQPLGGRLPVASAYHRL